MKVSAARAANIRSNVKALLKSRKKLPDGTTQFSTQDGKLIYEKTKLSDNEAIRTWNEPGLCPFRIKSNERLDTCF